MEESTGSALSLGSSKRCGPMWALQAVE